MLSPSKRTPMSYLTDSINNDRPVAPFEADRSAHRRSRMALGVLAGLAVLALTIASATNLDVATLAAGLVLLVLVLSLLALSRRDAVTLLTLAIVLLFLIPQPYVLVGPLRSVGNPA